MRADRARRNAAVFLLYAVARHADGGRPWFAARALLFCCGAENGVVRAAGLVGLPLLFRGSQRRADVEAAVRGRGRPPGEDAPLASGQPRAQVALTLLRLARTVALFCDLLLALVEPEFLIFPDIDPPAPAADGSALAAAFYYNSFSPVPAVAESFRRLWRWATDGGRRVSIADTIAAIDPAAEGFDGQRMNVACLHDVVQRMTTDQMQEHLPRLAPLAVRMLYGPETISVAALDLLRRMVEKCGQCTRPATRAFVLGLAADFFAAQQRSLIALATQWCRDAVPLTADADATLALCRTLFQGLAFFPTVTELLTGETWGAYTAALFRAAEFDLARLFGDVRQLLNEHFVLESQRYAVLTALDVVVRSPQRLAIGPALDGVVERLLSAASGEKSQPVVTLLIAVVVRALRCVFGARGTVLDYDEQLCHLYFDCERPDIAALFLRQIVAHAPECLRRSIAPLVLFGSFGEKSGKDFAAVLKDEIALAIEVNAAPELFMEFAWVRGVAAGPLALRPIGCRALLAAVAVMKGDVKRARVALTARIMEVLPGRLWPFKENLIDTVALFVPVMEEISDSVVQVLLQQAARQKSVFRAAAFRCLLAVAARRVVPQGELIEQMIDAVRNGTVVAQQAALACFPLIAESERVAELLSAVYEKLADVKQEDFERFCKCVLELPPHEVPASFDLIAFAITATPIAAAPAVAELLAKLSLP
jgi:hypothetical protein